jgi:hypothetical protein
MKKMLASLLIFGMAFASNTATSTAISTATSSNIPTQLEGCLNQTLFNGVWQLKARTLERIPKIGWGLTLKVRNGSHTTIMPIEAGIGGTGTGIRMTGQARSLKVDSFDVATLTAKNLLPNAAVTGQLEFHDPYGKVIDISNNPTRFLLEVDPKRMDEATREKGVTFNVPQPGFVIRLDCKK